MNGIHVDHVCQDYLCGGEEDSIKDNLWWFKLHCGCDLQQRVGSGVSEGEVN